MATQINKKQIFTNAWALVRTMGMSLSEALKAAWAYVKNPKLVARALQNATILEVREKATLVRIHAWAGCECWLNVWFPNSQINTFGKFVFCSNWIFNEKTKELSAKFNKSVDIYIA